VGASEERKESAVVDASSVVELMKATKNPTEISGMKEAQVSGSGQCIHFDSNDGPVYRKEILQW
jgi:hypothetical protein